MELTHIYFLEMLYQPANLIVSVSQLSFAMSPSHSKIIFDFVQESRYREVYSGLIASKQKISSTCTKKTKNLLSAIVFVCFSFRLWSTMDFCMISLRKLS